MRANVAAVPSCHRAQPARVRVQCTNRVLEACDLSATHKCALQHLARRGTSTLREPQVEIRRLGRVRTRSQPQRSTSDKMIVSKVIGGIVGALVTIRYGLGLYAWRVSELLERPKYSVVEKLPGGIEVRAYDAYVIAEATMPGTPMRQSMGPGFGACAGYIFGGKNRVRGVSLKRTSRSMSMTAPVRMEMSNAATKVSFVMSANETVRSLPVPTDSSMALRQIKPHMVPTQRPGFQSDHSRRRRPRVWISPPTPSMRPLRTQAAFVRFSGKPPSEQRVAKERARLEAALAKHGYEVRRPEETLTYGYHDPFATPNLLRRNEVGLYVAKKRTWTA